MTFAVALLVLLAGIYGAAIIDRKHRRQHSAAFLVALLLIGAERWQVASRPAQGQQRVARLPFDEPLVRDLAVAIMESKRNADSR